MRGRRVSRVPLLALLGMLVGGCGIAVPPDKQDYVGAWQGPGMILVITAGGRVEYKRVKGAVTKSLSAPLKSFAGADFVVGALGIATTFHVQRPPYRDGEDWKMVVDSVELVRVRRPAPNAPPAPDT